MVFDSSALLAFIFSEAGSDAVEASFPGGIMSAVNLHEVLQKLSDNGFTAEQAEEMVDALPLRIVPHDLAGAKAAASLRPLTRPFGLSLGDRTCVALGRALNLPVLTADRVWKRLAIEGLEVILIR